MLGWRVTSGQEPDGSNGESDDGADGAGPGSGAGRLGKLVVTDVLPGGPHLAGQCFRLGQFGRLAQRLGGFAGLVLALATHGLHFLQELVGSFG